MHCCRLVNVRSGLHSSRPGRSPETRQPKPALPVPPGADKRKSFLEKAVAAAAQKMKEETQQKAAAAAARTAEKERALVRDAALEYLRQTFGKKAPTSELLERLKHACKCHKTMAPGSNLHKYTCSLHPDRLKATLAHHEQTRESMSKQLSARTTLSPAQRKSGLEHLYGPKSSFTGASGSASTQGSDQNKK